MKTRTPLMNQAKGHVERLGAYQFLAIVDDCHGNHHELVAEDPHAAQTAAEEFCDRNGLALAGFAVPPEVVKAHMADIGEFLDEHVGERVRPAAQVRRAI